MALIECDAAFFNDTCHDAGFCCAGADCANAAVLGGDPIDLGAHFCCSKESIFADIHRRAAGMSGLAMECDCVSLDAERAENRSQRQIQIEKYGSLLDVQFDICGSIF